MEGMSNYWLVWLIYIGFGIVGVWCWDKLFFWLKKGGDMRRLAMMLGAVLLLTPAPIPETEGLFAPAIYILILDLLSGSSPLRSEEHTSELQSRPHLVCRLLLEKKNKL